MPFWKHKKVVDHPVFGEIEFSREQWIGEVSFLESSQIGISLPGTEDGPLPFCSEAFKKLRFIFQTLSEAIDSELFRVFKEYATLYDIAPEAEFPVISRPEDISKILSMISITVRTENVFELIYCFHDSDDDGLFSIRIDRLSVTGEYIGD